MKSALLRSLPALLAALIVAGCGGGGGSAPTTTLSGTAATGAPVAGGAVSVLCSTGSATTITAANGTWHVEIVNPVFPCSATVSGGSLAAGQTLVGYSASLATALNINVTPLTTLIGAYAIQAAAGASLTQALLDAGIARLNALLLSAGFPTPPSNPLYSVFTPAPGDAYDDYLELLMPALASQNLPLTTLVSQISTTGSPAAPLKGPDVVAFDSLPSPFPSNMPSLGFEAEGLLSLGDRGTLAAGSARVLRSVTVAMSSWACQNGSWNVGDCVTAEGATYTHPVTLRVFDGNGTLVATRTQDFTIPYRPSTDASCTGGKWKDATGACFNGKAFQIAFDLRSLNVTMPEDFSFDLQYNTRTYGTAPIGGANGPYDSLNVGVYDAATVSPTVGTDRDVGSYLWNGSLLNDGYGLMARVITGAN